MKKLVLVLMLVALLLSFTLTVAWAGMNAEDPCPPGSAKGNVPAHACQAAPQPGFGNGKAGNNWIKP